MTSSTFFPDLVELYEERRQLDTGFGHLYRLGKDDVHHHTSDAHRSVEGDNCGFPALNVQLFIQGTTIRAVPNSRPGTPVDPTAAYRTARARVHFIPEVERAFGDRFRFSIAA